MKVCLTHEGLSRLDFDHDFELKTDKDSISCSRSQISFISPVISKLLRTDPTINKFKLKTPNSSQITDCLRSLLNGSSAIITPDLIETYRSVSLELGNDELLQFYDSNLTLDNVHEILKQRHARSLSVEKSIKFVASHFYELQPSDIWSHDIEVIDSILGSSSLVVVSEHSLFTFITDLISERGDDFRFLLSHLHLEYLDSEDISSFIEFIDEKDIGSLLPCISRRLLLPLADNSISKSDKKRFTKINIPFQGRNFEGIFSYLWKVTEGNPVTNGVVSIEESTNRCPEKVSYLVDPIKRNQADWWFGTDNSRGAFVIIDFKELRVSLSGYSLKAAPSEQWGDGAYMRSWKIDGSNDKIKWTMIDKRKDTHEICRSLAEAHFPCKQSPPFRYFRILMTGENSSGNYFMGIHAIELMGSLST